MHGTCNGLWPNCGDEIMFWTFGQLIEDDERKNIGVNQTKLTTH
jgi:hypothetical protein